jgi:[acyl-carrier-protein] S-malonyltransferase
MPQVAFLFPGQGAQAVGMGRQLCETSAAARKLFDEAARILGYNLLDVCSAGPAERLNATAVSQPAIFVTSLAALEKLRDSSPEVVEQCRGAAGLSLGEYTALVFAGALSFQDGLRVVKRRGEAMQAAADAAPSAMVSVLGLEPSGVEELCASVRKAGSIEIANMLCPRNVVISGATPACELAEKEAERMGARTVRLAVAGAFHTAFMKPADEALAAALKDVQLGSPRVPVWSNVDAQPHSSPDEIRQLLVKQVLRPVLWEQTMRNMLAAGFDRFYEMGPGRVLAGLLKRVERKIDCQNVPA